MPTINQSLINDRVIVLPMVPTLLLTKLFQDQTHFPRRSRAWKFYKKISTTFQEAWESWLPRTLTFNPRRAKVIMPPTQTLVQMSVG